MFLLLLLSFVAVGDTVTREGDYAGVRLDKSRKVTRQVGGRKRASRQVGGAAKGDNRFAKQNPGFDWLIALRTHSLYVFCTHKGWTFTFSAASSSGVAW